MAIKLHISPRIIPSIATLYNDVNRIFMEYVDNSIDSADQNWYKPTKNAYSRPVEIRVGISGHSHKDGAVTISDNCFGITNFTKVVESIGDSDKKNQRFTNGQFGFGIFSFMAACGVLEVTSKEINKNAQHLKLSRLMFDEKRVEDVKIIEPNIVKKFFTESGTTMRLSEFDKESWKSIVAKTLKEEIEKHFEVILRRENLAVIIVDEYGEESRCQAFEYDKYEGEVYEDFITHLILEVGRKYKSVETIEIKPAVRVFLKFTKGVSLNKPPVFISKGRRICEIKDVKSFKSQHKGDIWGHAIVTGYIDLGGLLGPTIARNDFKSDKNSRALFQQLVEIEELALEYVQRANANTDEKHYQQLEDALNKALSKLARVDSMNFRTSFLKGGDKNLSGGSIGTEYVEGVGASEFGDGEIENPGEGVGGEEGVGLGAHEGGSDLPGGSVEGDQAKNEELFADSEFKGKEHKKSGFNIHISDAEPQVDAETGKQLRSLLSGEQIVIFKKHPDFQVRLQHTRQGGSKITARLLSYIAGEVTVHYKDQFYNKRQNGQPEYSKNMFVGMAEFIYQLEDALSTLSGKNLSELSL